jgi:hypothetical protein
LYDDVCIRDMMKVYIKGESGINVSSPI